MADIAQANWNAVRIIYSLGDVNIPIEDRDRICLFHWTQSLKKLTKANIRLNIQEQHCRLCKQYINVETLRRSTLPLGLSDYDQALQQIKALFTWIFG